jgi:hypothetical protein
MNLKTIFFIISTTSTTLARTDGFAHLEKLINAGSLLKRDGDVKINAGGNGIDSTVPQIDNGIQIGQENNPQEIPSQVYAENPQEIPPQVYAENPPQVTNEIAYGKGDGGIWDDDCDEEDDDREGVYDFDDLECEEFTDDSAEWDCDEEVETIDETQFNCEEFVDDSEDWDCSEELDINDFDCQAVPDAAVDGAAGAGGVDAGGAAGAGAGADVNGEGAGAGADANASTGSAKKKEHSVLFSITIALVAIVLLSSHAV